MKSEGKKLAVVLFATVISLFLHSLLPENTVITADNVSVVVRTLSFVGTVTVFFLGAYYAIGTVFLKYQSRLPGNKWQRALLFGGLVGGIWWVGMVEGVFALGTSFSEEFFMGLADFIPIPLLCVLLAHFLVKDEVPQKTLGTSPKGYPLEALVFILVFVVGRGFRYYLNAGGYSPESIIPLMVWTTSFALMVGLNYVYLKPAFTDSSHLKSARQFTLVIFGVHYAFFVYFVPLVFKDMLLDLTLVFVVDLGLVFVASVLSGLLRPGLRTISGVKA